MIEKTYTVSVPMEGVAFVSVEATSKEEALKKLKAGEWDDVFDEHKDIMFDMATLDDVEED